MSKLYKVFTKEREKFKILARENPNDILILILRNFSFRPDLINFAYNLYFQHYSEIELKMIQDIDIEDNESQYLVMIKLSKNNQELASNLDDYANFLKDDLKDYPKAQEMYERAIEADPKHANNLGNYALFLADDLKDYPKAQEMYERAIEADPKRANTLGNYALFLAGDLKDYPKAQEMYERAIEADPKHANNLGNYAKFLFVMSDYDKGIKLLERAESDKELHGDLAIELAFYRYAHITPYALNPLKVLLLNGVRSIDWDLSDNVAKAIEEKHPDSDMIATIANVISGNETITALNKFLKWNEE